MANQAERDAFFEKYAPAAMEQMIKYGIPASVTLAQAAVESGWETSTLASQGHNLFGIKAHSDWKGEVMLLEDDQPNEKFRVYQSAAASIEDHSKFLLNNERYADRCFAKGASDWQGWTVGLQQAGYATAKNYATTLQGVIKSNGLAQYDKLAMQMAASQGKQVGWLSPIAQAGGQEYSLPVAKDNLMGLASGYQETNPQTNETNKGIDLRVAPKSEILATETGGKVIDVAYNESEKNFRLSVEYNDQQGAHVVVYDGLSKVSVLKGETVNASQKLGIVFGADNEGGVVHIEVGTYSNERESGSELVLCDPIKDYLEPLVEKGDLDVELKDAEGRTVLSNLSATQAADGLTSDAAMLGASQGQADDEDDDLTEDEQWDLSNPEALMKRLFSSLGSGNDSILAMIAELLIQAMNQLNIIDKNGQIQSMLQGDGIDLTPLLNGADKCLLKVDVEQGKSYLEYKLDGGEENRVDLTPEDMKKLTTLLKKDDLTQEQFADKVVGILTKNEVLSGLSARFDEGYDAAMGQSNDRGRGL